MNDIQFQILRQCPPDVEIREQLRSVGNPLQGRVSV